MYRRDSLALPLALTARRALIAACFEGRPFDVRAHGAAGNGKAKDTASRT
jgi:hypothetical protein